MTAMFQKFLILSWGHHDVAVESDLFVSLSNTHGDLSKAPAKRDPPNTAERRVERGWVDVAHVLADKKQGE